MTDFTKCNCCRDGGTLDTASEVERVNSNVREFRNEAFTVWRCSRCLSLHSMEDVNLERYYKSYPVKLHTLDSATRIAYDKRLALLKDHGLTKDQASLDYGCGQGLFVKYLRERGYNAEGYDSYVEEYSSRASLTKTYDYIFAQDLIEHVNDPSEFLSEILAFLNPGGHLAIGTPNADGMNLSRRDTFMMELHQPYHRHLLSERALVRLGIESGLKHTYTHGRWYYDTAYPFVNTRFIREYLLANQNMLDVLFEPPRVVRVLKSPRMLFWGLFGYFVPSKGTMMTVLFQN